MAKTAHTPAPKKPAATGAAAPPSPNLADHKFPVENIPLDRIVTDGKNHREDNPLTKARIAERARSMALPSGQLHPIRVYIGADGKFHLVYGFCRTEAAKKLSWKTIRAEVMQTVPSDADRHTMRAIENLSRADLTPAEEAIALYETVEARSVELGRENAIKRTALELGRDVDQVKKYLHVYEHLAPKAQSLLGEGKINIDHARELVKVSDPKTQEEFARNIARHFESGAIIRVAELRGWMQDQEHSLAAAQWEPEIAFDRPAARKHDVKLLACKDCRFNKANDVSLFEPTKEEASRGVCTFHACWVASQDRVARENEKTAANLQKMLKARSIPADTVDIEREVKAAAPTFIKPEVAKKSVEMRLGLQPDKKGKLTVPAAGTGEEGVQVDFRAARKRALVQWGLAYQEWLHALTGAIDAAVKKDPILKVAAVLLSTNGLKNHYRYPGSDLDLRGVENADPPEEHPVTPSQAKLIGCVKSLRDREAGAKPEMISALAELAKEANPLLESYEAAFYLGNDLDCGPEMAFRIANAFGAGPAPWPDFREFLVGDAHKYRELVGKVVSYKAGSGKKVLALVEGTLKGDQLQVRSAGNVMTSPLGAECKLATAEEQRQFVKEAPWFKGGGASAPAAAVAGSANGSSIEGTFKPNVILALKLGGDLGLCEGLKGKLVMVRWLEDGEASAMKPEKLRTATKEEQVLFAEKAKWWKPGARA